MSGIDLHTHTTCSDGSFSPTALVQWAHTHSIHTLSITDHDTTEGLEEALVAARNIPIEIIPGIEISARNQGRETHVLGYFIKTDDPTFTARISRLQGTRLLRVQEILHKLGKVGIDIPLERVKALAGTGSIGRPHIAQLLIEGGHVANVHEAFAHYLGSKGKAYAPRDVPEVAEVFAWIREAGGIAILAHPYWDGYRTDEATKACEALVEQGLQGLEVFYGTFSAKQISFNLHLAKQLGLLLTGGSDFHGTLRPEIAIGRGRGSLKVPPSVIDKLRKAAGH
jgi:3',5'-nucleoside bisphosphate phosphatase